MLVEVAERVATVQRVASLADSPRVWLQWLNCEVLSVLDGGGGSFWLARLPCSGPNCERGGNGGALRLLNKPRAGDKIIEPARH